MIIRRATVAALLVVGLGAAPAVAAPDYTYPPAAPVPTSSGPSPDAPDPHPPAGGVGPGGAVVGGARLASRDLVLPPHAPALPAGIGARAWILVDLDTGNVLAARDPHGRYQPASILKLLTSVTLIPRLAGSTTVIATKAAADTEGSHAGIVAGGRYTVDDLFRALLLVSGNDAAAALAQAAGGVARTVALMNREALALGAYDTYVQTPSGLDGWQLLTSAYDMALVLRAAISLPRLAAYDRTLRAYLPSQPVVGRVEVDNQNAMWLQKTPGALVVKNGFTDAAQHTYLAAVRRHGRALGVILLRDQRWPVDQFEQADRLLDWGYALPKGTPRVGHLDAVVRRIAPATAAPTSPVALRAAATPAAADRPPSASTMFGLSHLELVLIALVLFGGVVVSGWRIGRARPARR